MSDVKRYDCYGKDALGYDYSALSREAIDGDWVLAEDHIAECDALAARLAEVVGIVQRTLQPAGSPPPGGEEILIRWICDSANARLAEAERDAARIEWLASNPRGGQIVVDGKTQDCVFWGISGHPRATLRDAIDAARATNSAPAEETAP